jgi:hypothetical protein
VVAAILFYMHIRRLDPEKDRELFILAYQWEHENVPRWFREMDEAFPMTLDEWLGYARDEKQASVGVFDGEMKGLIYTHFTGRGTFDSHISAPRRAPLRLLMEGIIQLRHSMFRDLNAQVVYGWLARGNRGLWRLAEMCGFRPDGCTMLKGKWEVPLTDGSKVQRPIEWARIVYTREDWLN